jgi:DNA-binding winged helix-turn-helix (wHTH) protein
MYGSTVQPPRVLLALAPAPALRVAESCAELGCLTALAFSMSQLTALASHVDVVVGDESVDPSGSELARLSDAAGAACVYVPTQSSPNNPTIGSASIVARVLVAIEQRRHSHSDALRWGPLEMRSTRRSVRWHGRTIHLSPTEFDILFALVTARGSVVPKHELQRAIWPDAAPDDGERLHAHIRRIRSHLDDDTAHPRFLLTTRGVGFRLADLDDPDPSDAQQR